MLIVDYQLSLHQSYDSVFENGDRERMVMTGELNHFNCKVFAKVNLKCCRFGICIFGSDKRLHYSLCLLSVA